MEDEKSLDEALDEIDSWSERLVREIESLTPAQAAEYFKQAKARLEKLTGKRLDLPDIFLIRSYERYKEQNYDFWCRCNS
jgi:hypothetical protein